MGPVDRSYPRRETRNQVMVILMGVTGLGHLTLGTVDLRLVAALLVGSVPGVLVGSGLTGVFSAELLRRVLLVLLIVAGIHMV